MARDQFDCLLAERGRVMTLALHPYLCSQPYRQRFLEETLEYMTGQSGVWVTTAGQVAAHFRQHYLDSWFARSVNLAGAGYDL